MEAVLVEMSRAHRVARVVAVMVDTQTLEVLELLAKETQVVVVLEAEPHIMVEAVAVLVLLVLVAVIQLMFMKEAVVAVLE